MAENIFSDLSKVIDAVGKDKGIEKQIVIDAVCDALLTAARKKYGTYREIEASYNETTGEVELFEFKEVVTKDKFVDEEVEITLEEARKLDPQAQLNDSIGIKMETGDLGRIAAQTAKQIILQKVRDAERDIIFSEFEQRKGEIASGIARRVEKGAIVVDLGRTEAHIPPREQIPGEQYKPGDRIQGFLMEVRQTTKGPQIIMSRASEEYLIKLFEMEVPEIYDGIVEILSAAREPGVRAKIAVRTNEPSVDPVGACVGMKGSRVQNIVQELKGEKIDIVPWNEDITRFVCNALAPAEISRVFLDEGNKEIEIVVPDSQLSLAIGKRGVNVRLAAKLTGWRIDIISESVASSRTAEAIFNLMLIPSMTQTMAQNIFQSGFGSFQAVAQASTQDIMSIPGYEDPDKADRLINAAKDLIEKYQKEGVPVPTSPQAVKETKTNSSAKEQADQRLKEELQKLQREE
ncbi:MAG: transcription termination factor NusA [Bdellovibrionaceae bacterium]|nr:transcription termination factor NusA [Pseudobdellovibrionaceae bacterium]NUM60418.1 transcription termination/antitermination protein NusA [Pseudobdellovibrionaceae bacterium]